VVLQLTFKLPGPQPSGGVYFHLEDHASESRERTSENRKMLRGQKPDNRLADSSVSFFMKSGRGPVAQEFHRRAGAAAIGCAALTRFRLSSSFPKKKPETYRSRGFRILSSVGVAHTPIRGGKWSYVALGRSSDFRFFLLAAPSHPVPISAGVNNGTEKLHTWQWHCCSFRPRSQRRVRNGITPFSLEALSGNP
jgi:hypothetical protein